MRLPNLLLPGAQKSATTTLFTLLSPHSEIYGGPKEPHFFSKDDLYDRGAGFYGGRYNPEPQHRYILDASQSYLPLPDVPGRIYETLGDDVRFIIVLRHPVDRIESAFKHFRVKPDGEVHRRIDDLYPSATELRGTDLEGLLAYERSAVADALAAGRIVGRHPSWTAEGFPFTYAEVSCYARHLSRYLEYFPRECFLFLRFEDLTQDQAATMERVTTFLGLDAPPPLAERTVNATPKRYKSERVRHLVGPPKRVLKALLPLGVRNALGRVERRLFKTHVRIHFEPETHAALTRLYVPEVEATAALTGLDLSNWLASRRESSISSSSPLSSST